MDDELVLRKIANSVIQTMYQIPELDHLQVEQLNEIPLGFLRKDATRSVSYTHLTLPTILRV